MFLFHLLYILTSKPPREFQILTKRLFLVTRCQFQKRAPKAVKEIKKFATLHMGTTDVRLDPKLNIAIWKRGVQGVENRMRLRISRKRNDEEDAKRKIICLR